MLGEEKGMGTRRGGNHWGNISTYSNSIGTLITGMSTVHRGLTFPERRKGRVIHQLTDVNWVLIQTKERVVRVIHGGVVAFGRTVLSHGDDRGVNPTLSLTMEGLMQFV